MRQEQQRQGVPRTQVVGKRWFSRTGVCGSILRCRCTAGVLQGAPPQQLREPEQVQGTQVKRVFHSALAFSPGKK